MDLKRTAWLKPIKNEIPTLSDLEFLRAFRQSLITISKTTSYQIEKILKFKGGIKWLTKTGHEKGQK